MEEIIGLRKANCKNCYKCIRNCPVKSLTCRDEQVRILDDECIYCGNCLMVCPQNAKYIHSDLPRVKEAIAQGEKLYVSLAPSYMAAFPDAGVLQVSAALKKLGFTHVEETAIGAAQVTREYESLIAGHTMPNIITSACPSINLLVQKYYPALIGQLAPVVTPAVAHARMIKQIYGTRAKVVFIGPCISKKYETHDPENGNALFAVLNFTEVAQWLKEANVSFGADDKEGRTLINVLPRFYPVPGGIIQNLNREARRQYECVSMDGVDRCIDVLDSILRDGLSGYFLELNACSCGCLGGPILKMMNTSYLGSKDALMKRARSANQGKRALTEGIQAKFNRSFKNLSVKSEEADESEIRRILALTGKTSPEKELNCGCCGYSTCREKAIAVLKNKADIHMCVPYMRELAESMSSTVVENIPTGVLILNERLEIDYINPAAVKLLKLEKDAVGSSIGSLLKSNDFYEAMSAGKNMINHLVRYEEYGLIVEQTVINVQESRLLFVLLSDVTRQEQEFEARRRTAEENAAYAKEVIGKQMRAVQEIANLLGETTTETRMALSQLLHTMDTEKGTNYESVD